MTVNKKNKTIDKKKIDDEIKNLVLARIQAASKTDLGILVGDDDSSREDVIESIKAGGSLGARIIEAHMDFLKAMASGEIYQNE